MPCKNRQKKAGKAIIFLGSRLHSLVKPTQMDDLQMEWNALVMDKSVFDGKYSQYLQQVADENVSKFQRVRIDEVWAPVIRSSKFKILSPLLKGLLSLFHAMAAVEGSVNNIGNTLGSCRHNWTDENLNSQAFVKSRVKASSASCCYSYNYDKKSNKKTGRMLIKI